jgi:bifunctional non-homologous end joining protein LigD
MPAVIEPMKAVTGALPTDEGWAFEVKWDGMRITAFCDRGSIRLQTTNRLDATARFVELAPLADELRDHQVVLDGEVVAFSDAGRPDFGRLQSRMHGIPTTGPGSSEEPVAISYVVFDLLWLDGVDAMPAPYLDRRRLLTELVEPGAAWQVPAHQVGDGEDLLRAVTDRGLEGVMAKRIDSVYLPGKRSTAWRKVKVRRRQELVVGGWLPGAGARASSFGALLVGYHTPEGLHYAGRVGTGFDATDLALLQAELGARSRGSSPFVGPLPAPVARHGRWVEPELVVEIAFGEWTSADILRHPSYVGLRLDKDATEVGREPTP